MYIHIFFGRLAAVVEYDSCGSVECRFFFLSIHLYTHFRDTDKTFYSIYYNVFKLPGFRRAYVVIISVTIYECIEFSTRFANPTKAIYHVYIGNLFIFSLCPVSPVPKPINIFFFFLRFEII